MHAVQATWKIDAGTAQKRPFQDENQRLSDNKKRTDKFYYYDIKKRPTSDTKTSNIAKKFIY